MRIETSQFSYASTHYAAEVTARIDRTIAGPKTSTAAPGTGVQPVKVDTVQLSSLTGAGMAGTYASSVRDDLQGLSPKERLAWLAIEALLGHRIQFNGYHPGTSSAGAAGSAGPGSAGPGSTGAGSTGAAVGQVQQETQVHYEAERTSFQAAGQVQTADGRTIQFSATLNMQREFASVTSSTEPVKSTDPLVINFGGAPAQLTGAEVTFDLNSDGTPESISFVGSGSGFLAIDKNGDGKVDNGQELFGPQTGSGFGELAAYDGDHNGWIDENDPVFSKLRIWTQDGLSTLADKGVGAISTSSADTPFAMKDGTGALQGNVSNTGVYLSENGAAGTIQEVDLTTPAA